MGRDMVTRDMRVTKMVSHPRYDGAGKVRIDKVTVEFTSADIIAGYGASEPDFLEVKMNSDEASFIKPDRVYRVDIREVDE